MRKSVKIFLPLFVVYAILLLIFPRSPKFGYDYHKGMPWKYETLIAEFDFPILKTGAQMEQERAALEKSVIPYYKYNSEIADRSLRNAAQGDFGELNEYRGQIVSELNEIYLKGILNEEGINIEDQSEDQAVVFIQKGKRADKYPASEIYVASEARKKLLSELKTRYKLYELDELFRSSGADSLIVPNLFFDEAATRLVSMSNEKDISPTMGYVKAGEVIVSKDEMVTVEIEQIIDSYGKEYDSTLGYSRSGFLFWVGNGLIALVVVAMLYFVIIFYNSSIFSDLNRYLYILLLFLIFTLATIFIIRFGKENYLYLVPYSLAAIFLCAFFDRGLAISVYAVTLLPLLLFAKSGLTLYTTFLVGGAASVYCFQYLQRGWKQFLLALLVFVCMFATYAGFRLLDVASGDSRMTVIYLLASCFLCVAGYPLTYLFERVFGLVSNSRLVELSDTSNSLLRELEHTAPGTFQHSLQVGNMADFVGRTVGANPLLLRTGALYHDIGKINNPLCFVENESLVAQPESSKYHSQLSSLESARDIIHHVEDGLSMADKNHIPSIVKDFILTHHGTSSVGYFFNKYMNEGGDPALESEFRYPGRKPQTAEQLILMLCDSVEAASRTLQSHTPEEYDQFVEKIAAGKMAEGQFDEADISIRDLGKVKDALKTYLAQAYHERVVYPKRKQNK